MNFVARSLVAYFFSPSHLIVFCAHPHSLGVYVLRTGAVIIFDWDDTLLASSFLSSKGYRLDVPLIPSSEIEADLKKSPLIAEAVLVGDRRPYLTVLLVLDPERLAALARENGAAQAPADPNAAPYVRKAIEGVVGRLK